MAAMVSRLAWRALPLRRWHFQHAGPLRDPSIDGVGVSPEPVEHRRARQRVEQDVVPRQPERAHEVVIMLQIPSRKKSQHFIDQTSKQRIRPYKQLYLMNGDEGLDVSTELEEQGFV